MTNLTLTPLVPIDELMKPYSGPVTTIKGMVDPDAARKLLTTMKPNRNLRPSVVDAYARQMPHDWRDTGESMKIDRDGDLIDGDHRCHAIIKANAPVLMSITIGVDPEDRKYIDVGARRKSSDVLTFEGFKNSTVLAAAVRLGILDQLGFLETSGGLKTGGGTYQVTRTQEFAYMDEHPELPEIVNRYTQIARRVFLPTGVFAYAMSTLEGISSADAQLFAKSLDESITKGAGDPLNALLTYTRKNMLAKGRIGNGEALWLVFTTWNAWRDDKQLSTLKPFSGTKEKPIPREIPTPH